MVDPGPGEGGLAPGGDRRRRRVPEV